MKILPRKLISVALLITLITCMTGVSASASMRTKGSGPAHSLTVSSGEAGSALVDQKKAEVSAAAGDNLKWVKFDGGFRIQAPNGKYRKGFVKYKNKMYYFDSNGYLKTGFFKVDGKIYYASLKKGYKGKGEILTGLVKIGKYYYYLDPSSKPHAGALKKGFQTIKRKLYYFNSKGHLVIGWFKVSGKKYYSSCNKAQNTYGQVLTGVWRIGKNRYRFNEITGELLGNAYNNSKKYPHMIDVSEHNGNIDFKKVKASGIKAVVIRAGFGDCDVDKYFYSNIKKAKAAGLRVGVYWFSYAFTKQQALKEANYCLRVIKKYRLDMPVYYDWEDDSMRYAKEHGAKPNRSSITAMTQVFCDTITKAGRRAGYYFNLSYLRCYYDPSKLKKYSTWYAYWGNNIFDKKIWLRADMISPPKKYDLWQFSAVGTVSGVSGVVDCDLLLDSSIIK